MECWHRVAYTQRTSVATGLRAIARDKPLRFAEWEGLLDM